jgi:hypothetical protein
MVRLAGPQLLNFWGIICKPSNTEWDGKGVGVLVGIGRGVEVGTGIVGEGVKTGDGMSPLVSSILISFVSIEGSNLGRRVGMITSSCRLGKVALGLGNAVGRGVTT